MIIHGSVSTKTEEIRHQRSKILERYPESIKIVKVKFRHSKFFCGHRFQISKFQINMAKNKLRQSDLLFSNRDLFFLLVPAMIEQLLNSLMGTVDSMMVSNIGGAAISAVSLTDSINVLIIQMFSALAAGGTIICSQYLGKDEPENCNKAAHQVFLSVLIISAAVTILCVALHNPLLSFIFGQVDDDVMEASRIYFLTTALSYPFIAMFNVHAAFFRSEGNSGLPMKVSVSCNLLNIAGNAFLIFGLHLGVFGAALSTLISRAVMAFVMLFFQRRKKQVIVIRNYLIRPDFALIITILSVGIPSGIENGMFQFGKLAIQSTVSTLGTAAIAAEAMAILLENLSGIAGIGMGIGLMTVVGQCIGAGKPEMAGYYIKKVTLIAEVVVTFTTLLMYSLTGPITRLAGLEQESAEMCLFMMTVITIMKPIFWTLAFVPAYGLRAAGDVKFSMLTSTCTMWFCRVALVFYLIRFRGFGPIGVWIGQISDWGLRALIFSLRFRSRKWLRHKVV